MIIVCGGIKGGTGKPTVASNLAALRSRTHDVLLVDADEQESITIFTGIRKSEQRNPHNSPRLFCAMSKYAASSTGSRVDMMMSLLIRVDGIQDHNAPLSPSGICSGHSSPRSLDIWTIEC